MTKNSHLNHPDLILGPLPHQTINKTLGMELEAGDVIFTRAAQRHAARHHPNDYPRCSPHAGAVVSNPLYIGDDLKNPGKIELIARISALGHALLVAVSVERTEDGRYHVCSLYPISDRKVQSRREKGHLRVAKS